MDYRHEHKYIISNGQVKIIQHQMQTLGSLDSNARNGMYHIRSLYFDDLYNSSYAENAAGIMDREKWRIRAYNYDDNYISLECKKKKKDMIKKDSCRIDRRLLLDIVNDANIEIREDMPNVLKRFLCLRDQKPLRPVVIVGYDRIPFVVDAGNVRVTLDLNIYSAPPDLGLFCREDFRRPIMPLNTQLLEVKFDEFLPDYVYRGIQLSTMERTTFSKFYLSRYYLGGI